MRPRSFILLAFLIILTSRSSAQQDTSAVRTLVRITLSDGLELIGTVTSEDSGQVAIFSTSQVAMQIPRKQIVSIEQLAGTVVGGVFRHADPNATRLFFAPTGRALKSGQGYFSAYEIFFPFLAVGIADVVTLAGGMSLLPGADEQIVYLAPKVTPFHFKNTDVSFGLLYINSTSGSKAGVGIIYSVGTYGTPDAALTVGAGWGFAEGELSNKPVLLLGGEYRLSRSLKFITENWIPSSTNWAVYSFGVRFFGESLSADLGFIRPSKFESDGFPFIPWIGFAYNFGRR